MEASGSALGGGKVRHVTNCRDTLVVIPAWNEEASVGNVVRAAMRYADVVVVDDGSDDATAVIATQIGSHCLQLPQNRGVTAALSLGTRWGIENGYTTFVLMDADGAHDPRDIPLLLECHARDSNQVTIGARADFRTRRPTILPSTKYAANFFATRLTNLVLGTDFPDVACGYRVLSSSSAPELTSRGRGFGGMYEMLRQARDMRLRVGFAPITARYDARDILLTSRTELLDLLEVLADWVVIDGKSHLDRALSQLIEGVRANQGCAVGIGNHVVCLVSVSAEFFMFQFQDPHLIGSTNDVLVFEG